MWGGDGPQETSDRNVGENQAGGRGEHGWVVGGGMHEKHGGTTCVKIRSIYVINFGVINFCLRCTAVHFLMFYIFPSFLHSLFFSFFCF